MGAEMKGEDSELGGSEEAFGNCAEEENLPNSDGLDGLKVQEAGVAGTKKNKNEEKDGLQATQDEEDIMESVQNAPRDDGGTVQERAEARTEVRERNDAGSRSPQ